MCGIIGYNGTKKCVAKLIGALEALEYRGYDSAGVAYIKNGNVEIKKEKGTPSLFLFFILFSYFKASLHL